MKIKYLAIMVALVVPAILLASGDSAEAQRYLELTGRHTDFVPRIFNFLIFFGILVYLLAKPIKSFFTGRQAGISGQLKEIEAKLQASKEEKKAADLRIEESKKRAAEIIETAHKEAKLLASNLAEKSDQELKILEKQALEKTTLEERRVVREVIYDVMSSDINSKDILLDEKKIVDLLDERVA